MIYGKKDTTNIWLIPVAAALMVVLIGVCSGSSLGGMQLATPQYLPLDPEQQEPNGLNAAGESENPWMSISAEKRKLKLMLVASIAVILGFLLMVLMTSLLRMGRQYRRRVLYRKTSKPTEHVDAWSNYRLKENWQDDLPDEFQKPDTQ